MEPVTEVVRSVEINAGNIQYSLNLYHEDFSALYPGMIRFSVIVKSAEKTIAVSRTNSFEYSPLVPLAAANIATQIFDEWEREIRNNPMDFVLNHRQVLQEKTVVTTTDLVVIQGSPRGDGNCSILTGWAVDAAHEVGRTAQVIFPMTWISGAASVVTSVTIPDTVFLHRVAVQDDRVLARNAKASASAVRGPDPAFAAARVNDGDATTYWTTDDTVTAGAVTLEFPAPIRFDRVVLQEYVALGQRVQSWTVEAEVDGQWKPLTQGATIGHKRIARCPPVVTSKVRLSITQARACPTIATCGLYASPTTR